MNTPEPEQSAAAAWTVLCDFDGTISVEDVTDSLLERFAAPGWKQLEDAWRAGAIGSRECMARQVRLLDCSRDELDSHLAAMAIDPQFQAFADAVQASGATLRIVSDGLDIAIHALLVRHRIAGVEVFASRLVPTGERNWRLDFPYARSDCMSAGATCKCALAERPTDGSAQPVLMVGDGRSDFCVAGRADLVWARGDLLTHCAGQAYRHRAVADFGAALCLWNELTSHPAGALAPADNLEALDARG